MTEVAPADHSRLLRSKVDGSNAIASSRKRKLRHLLAVATEGHAAPSVRYPKNDANAATPVESKLPKGPDAFLDRTSVEKAVPRRPYLRSDALKRTASAASSPSTENASLPASRQAVDGSLARGSAPFTKLGDANEVSKGAKGAASLQDASRKALDGPKAAAAVEKSPKKSVSLIPLPPVPGLSRSVTPVRPPDVTVSSLDERPSSDARVPGLQVDGDAAAKRTDRPRSRTPVPLPLQGSAIQKNGAVKPPRGPSTDDKAGPHLSVPTTIAADTAVDGAVVDEVGPVSTKVSQDASKLADVPSSPGSTTQTATTPAVHDISTDTSPDNEGPRYVERVDGKETGVENDGGQSDEGEDDLPTVLAQPGPASARPGDGAEAQLLQQTQRSLEKGAGAVSGSPVVNPTLSLDATRQAASKGTPATEAAVAKSPRIPTAARSSGRSPAVANATIPDSQGSPSMEEMDIDQPTSGRDQELAAGSHADEAVSRGVSPQKSPKSRTPMPPKSSEVPAPSERAVTRVSTGAIRQKSVSEILGEAPRPSISVVDKPTTTKGALNQLTPVTSTPQSPTARTRSVSGRRKDKPKGQVSTVVFGKQPKKSTEKAIVSTPRQGFLPSDDYFTPLFVQGFTQQSKWMKPIELILHQAHKTVSTDDAFIAIEDNQACRVLRRVYHLQQNDKWSLRQPKRAQEPTRPTSHWDVLLQEVKWMRTDFREERKWKMAVARNLAYDCAEWVAAGPDERKTLQVNAFIPPLVSTPFGDDVAMTEATDQPTPDLVPSAEGDTPAEDDDLREVFATTIAPSAIFSMQEDDVVFGLRRSPTADQLLEELPLYGSPLKVPSFDLTGPQHDPDAHWRRPALPLSKYVESQMKLSNVGPPRKRSRFEYEDSDDDDEPEKIYFGGRPEKRAKLPPSDGATALFLPEMKQIRDRLHAGHQFRPPSDYPMPLQTFYENRVASQWTQAEDDELRNLVRDYSYNWGLISTMLSSKSMNSSGSERRTPWECFERWTNLEGLPSDMQKTQYFRTYFNRIETAQRVRQQQSMIAQQQAAAAAAAAASNGTSGPTAMTPMRIRPSTPVRVDRRRNQKHLTLIDAMRKLAKKRETTISKQQQAASAAAARKANEAAHPMGPTKTPREYSLMRWERDQQLAEKMAQYAQRQEAQRRASVAAAMQPRNALAMAATPGAVQVPQTAVPVGNNPLAAAAAAAARVNMPNQLVGQARPRMPMAAVPNGLGAMQAQMAAGGLVPPMPMNGLPAAAQMQAMQAPPQMSMANQPNQAVLMQARMIAEQQRLAVGAHQAQQQQPPVGHQASPQLSQAVPVPHSSPPNMRAAALNGAINAQNYMANAQAMMAAAATFNAANGGMGSPAPGLQRPPVPVNAARPQQNTAQQAALQVHLNQIEQAVRAKHPTLSPEEVRTMATNQLQRIINMQRQSMTQTAMSAAAGGAGGAAAGMPNGISMANTTSPHQYAALLRQQQQAAAAAVMAGAATQHQLSAAANAQLHAQQQQQQHQRQASGSATPSATK